MVKLWLHTLLNVQSLKHCLPRVGVQVCLPECMNDLGDELVKLLMLDGGSIVSFFTLVMIWFKEIFLKLPLFFFFSLSFLLFFFLFSPLFFKINFYWSIAALQCSIRFYCTVKWTSCTYTYALFFVLPFHTGHHTVLSRVFCAIQ